MIGGYFRIDGVWQPNQFTIYGAQSVLRAAFWGELLEWEVGLCAQIPADNLALGAVAEPAEADGYARQPLFGDSANWPEIGNVNGESYIESREFTFPLSDSLSSAVSRLFITDGEYVVAISSPLDGGLQILNSPFTTQYRLYLR